MSLALSTLIYEWRRYLAAVIALALSGVLILIFVGIFMGIGKSATATIDRANAEIMILAPQSESLLNDSAGVPRRIKPQIYLHPEVLAVDDTQGSGARWQNTPKPGEKRKDTGVQLMSVDPTPGSVSLPTDFSEATRVALLEPGAVAIDRTSLKTLGVKLGDRAQINGKTVKVAVVLDGYPSMMNTTVIVSRQTFRTLVNRPQGPRTGALFVKLKNPAKAEQVAGELNAASHGVYRAWLRQDLSKANEKALFEEAIIGIILGVSVVVGIIIGVAITSQTLRGAILASLKEFASFRALGVSMGSLRLVILELSFWVGIAGLAGAAGLIGLFALGAPRIGLPIAFQFSQLAQAGVLLLAIAMLSGVMALGMLKKSQPADLLR